MTAMLMTVSTLPAVKATAVSRPVKHRRSALGVQRVPLRSVTRRSSDRSEHEAGLPRPDTIQTTEQTDDVRDPVVNQRKTQNIQPGNISNENAERRADIGASRPPTLLGKYIAVLISPGLQLQDLGHGSAATSRRVDIDVILVVAEAQAFDGPAPETINGRLAMLGITSALAAEFATGVGLREQWLKAPAPILFSFAIIAIASYIPILKGFTRCVCTFRIPSAR